MDFSLRWCLSLLLLGLFFACMAPQHEHIVIDAGSSGTRFCRFPVVVQSGSCRSPEPKQKFCYKASTPLATATKKEIQTILALGLKKTGAWPTAAAKQRGEPVVLLGTGGFRRLPERQQKEQIAKIQSVLADLKLPNQVAVLSGYEEGRLAYRSMQELHAGRPIRILEVGGATIQVAWKNRQGKIEAKSAPFGIHQTFATLRNRSHFRFCYSTNDNKAATNHSRCKELISELLRTNPQIQKMRTGLRQTGVTKTGYYALGSAWKALLDYTGHTSADLPRIRQTAARLCSVSSTDIARSGVPMKYARRACYLASFGVALLEELGIQSVQIGEESWPRGAAVDGRYFSECNERGHQKSSHEL